MKIGFVRKWHDLTGRDGNVCVLRVFGRYILFSSLAICLESAHLIY